MKERCEFCGEIYDPDELEPTSFCGLYCRHCLELMVFEAQKAIEKLDERADKNVE